jgi:NAD(P)-dependent dehydrogenase (short-subunit alcohol dehydrogenase family)
VICRAIHSAVAFDAYGAIDCFFNNAGIEGKVMPMQEYDEAVFDTVIGVNLKGVFLGMRHPIPITVDGQPISGGDRPVDDGGRGSPPMGAPTAITLLRP